MSYILTFAVEEVLEFPAWYTACEIDADSGAKLAETIQEKEGAMKAIAQIKQVMKQRWEGGSGSRSLATWMEWQELKFILVSVGLPVLLVALLVQLLPPLLRLF